MLKEIKRASLRALKSAGLFEQVRNSKWRRDRLLILCYHSTALEDEHLWRPGLFMPATQLETRLDLLTTGGYHVLPLGEALLRLRRHDLPPAAVALTFDDGSADFYQQVYPMLKRRGLPATVYQTTYYSLLRLPIFHLICSYMLWKRRGQFWNAGADLGLEEPMDLRTERSRHQIMRQLIALTNQQNLTGREKNDVAAGLAGMLRIDYERLVANRILQVMNPEEIVKLAGDGVDFQLHTHRHRTPDDRALFQKEIEENRQCMYQLTGQRAEHFCYPSGVYNSEFLPWLRQEQVLSATTCDIRLASTHDDPLLLPRFVDTTGRTVIEYESWLSGVGHVLSKRKKATQRYIPSED